MKKIYLLGILAAFMLAGCSSAKTTESSSASAETSVVESISLLSQWDLIRTSHLWDL